MFREVSQWLETFLQNTSMTQQRVTSMCLNVAGVDVWFEHSSWPLTLYMKRREQKGEKRGWLESHLDSLIVQEGVDGSISSLIVSFVHFYPKTSPEKQDEGQYDYCTSQVESAEHPTLLVPLFIPMSIYNSSYLASLNCRNSPYKRANHYLWLVWLKVYYRMMIIQLTSTVWLRL